MRVILRRKPGTNATQVLQQRCVHSSSIRVAPPPPSLAPHLPPRILPLGIARMCVMFPSRRLRDGALTAWTFPACSVCGGQSANWSRECALGRVLCENKELSPTPLHTHIMSSADTLASLGLPSELLAAMAEVTCQLHCVSKGQP